MFKIIITTRFEKDIKLAKKRGSELSKLYFVMNELVHKRSLPSSLFE